MKISEEDFQRAMAGMKEFKEMQSRFANRETCVAYLVKETGLSARECAQAYDLYAALDLSKMPEPALKNEGEK